MYECDALYSTNFSEVFNFAKLFQQKSFTQTMVFTCKNVNGQHPRAMLLNPQRPLPKEVYTFEVGIALLTATSSSTDNSVDSA